MSNGTNTVNIEPIVSSSKILNFLTDAIYLIYPVFALINLDAVIIILLVIFIISTIATRRFISTASKKLNKSKNLSILTRFFEKSSQEKILGANIAIFGDSHCGKTTLCAIFCNPLSDIPYIDDVESTFGHHDYKTEITDAENNSRYILRFVDYRGQDHLTLLTSVANPDSPADFGFANIVIVLVSLDSEVNNKNKDYDKTKKLIVNAIKRSKEQVSDPYFYGSVRGFASIGKTKRVVIFINKIDRIHEMNDDAKEILNEIGSELRDIYIRMIQAAGQAENDEIELHGQIKVIFGSLRQNKGYIELRREIILSAENIEID